MVRRLPWWGWLLAVWAALYAAYNPWGGSVWHLWTQGLLPLPVRLLATLGLAAVLGLLCAATMRSIGLAGVLLMAAFLALALWTAVAYGALDARSGPAWEVLPQLLAGVVLTVGLRWPSFRRAASGVVAVADPDIEEHH